MNRMQSLLFLLPMFLLAACGGASTGVPEATLVEVTPLATNTAVPPTTISEPTAASEPTATSKPKDTPQPEPPTLTEQMDAYLTAETDAGRFSGVALVARSNEVIFNKGYGLADRESGTPNTPQTKFPIGTVTVPFTAMAIMQLQKQGKLSIEDSICDYLADCPEAWSAVQIRHLLAQSSGIRPGILGVEFQEESGTYALPKVILARFQKDVLIFEPGAFWRGTIDNPSYLLLGLIVESASGQPYETFLRENIFDPLGMNDTGLARDNTDRANGYFSALSKNPVEFQDISPLFSAAGLMSSMDDMFLWGKALLLNELVSADTMNAIFTPYTRMDDDFDTGFGWFMSTFDGRYSASMPGVGPNGFKADMVVLPEDDLMWIILANQGVDSSTIGDTLIRMVFAEE